MALREQKFWSLFIFLLSLIVAQSSFAQQRPNVILVMTDDQGWGDVEFAQQLSPSPDDPADQTYAGHPELKTPELSAMAAAGMKFDRFYSAGPVCSPTRASFLTGRHHRRTRIDNANNGRLLNRELTIAEIAKMLGYTTGHFGKWHLGTLDKTQFAIDSNRGGLNRLPGSELNFSAPWNDGYDVVFCTESRVQTFNPTDLDQDTRYFEGFESALALTDPSLDGDDSRVVMDRVVPFMQSAVAAGEPFMATVWFHTPHLPYTPIDQGTLNEFYSPAEQAAMDNNERGYYSALTAMDKQMGRLRQELQDMGIADDTLLVFTSDNGPENGVPFIQDLAKGNLRGNKRFLFEGGVRVPAIVEWPGQVAAGTRSDAIAGVVDFLPTLAELWGFDMPDDRPLDGESILPILNGTATERNGAMLWEYLGLRSILDPAGRFKAISTNSGAAWQLYDILADPKETNNLANSNPAQLDQLIAQWNQWALEVETHRVAESDYNDYIDSVSNASVDISSPVSLRPADLPANEPIVVLEKQFSTLTGSIAVNASGTPDTYNSQNAPGLVFLEPGTVVHSYLVHFAPDQTMQTQTSITFDNEIIAFASSEALINASDSLAFANPEVFTGGGTRGLDFDNAATGDELIISPDGKTVTVNLQSGANALDELRIFTAVEFAGARIVPTIITSLSDARIVGFTVNDRDDNNGGGGFPNLIGRNAGGVDNFAVYEFDLDSLAGETVAGATVNVITAVLNNNNHGTFDDTIVLSELATGNSGFNTGAGTILAVDNLTNDGSVSFLNRVQYNNSPGPPAGVSLPWLNEMGAEVANIQAAMIAVGNENGFGRGETPVLNFEVDEETAQRWIDDGLPGLVVSAIDSGNNLSRFAVVSPATIVFDVTLGLIGDVNGDGVVDLLDVQPFVDLILNGGFNPQADINQDGQVDLLDVQPFVDLLIG